MPGLRNKEDIDTSSWGVKEWRFARNWNACFLIAWTAFYGWIAIDLVREDASWLMAAPVILTVILIGGGGFVVDALEPVIDDITTRFDPPQGIRGAGRQSCSPPRSTSPARWCGAPNGSSRGRVFRVG